VLPGDLLSAAAGCCALTWWLPSLLQICSLCKAKKKIGRVVFSKGGLTCLQSSFNWCLMRKHHVVLIIVLSVGLWSRQKSLNGLEYLPSQVKFLLDSINFDKLKDGKAE